MPKKTTREALLERRSQIEARLKRLDAQERTRERKADTRRKIIAGALALEHAERDEDFGRELWKLIDSRVERERDRELFGLSPKEQEAAKEQGASTDGEER